MPMMEEQKVLKKFMIIKYYILDWYKWSWKTNARIFELKKKI